MTKERVLELIRAGLAHAEGWQNETLEDVCAAIGSGHAALFVGEDSIGVVLGDDRESWGIGQ